MYLSYSSPIMILTARPALSIFSMCSGFSMALFKITWSLRTIGSGTPFGPTMPRVEEEMTEGYPISTDVGTSA
jgi:hypothetical protein